MKMVMGAILSFILLFSCVKKDKDSSSQVTYTGYIYKSVDSTPHTNTSFSIHSYIAASLVSGRKSDEKNTSFSTNDDGYFKVSARVYGQGDIYLCWPDLKQITRISPTSGDLGIIYIP